MKLILRADVESLGRLGQIITVKPGYGRNYLIPQGLAMMASQNNLKKFELEKKKLQAKVYKLRTSAADVAERINNAKVIIAVRVGENNKLYGSVTSANIANALAEQGIEIDRRKITLHDPIRTLGQFEVEIKLHPEIYAAINLSVVRKGYIEAQPVTEAINEKPAASSTL